MDYVRAQYGDRAALALIHEAVRLSSHVIAGDAGQFASQLVARLLPHRDGPAVSEFIGRVSRGAPRPWIRALHPALDPPGTALVRTLAGHSGVVMGVAVSADGRRAVTASPWANTLPSTVFSLRGSRTTRETVRLIAGLRGSEHLLTITGPPHCLQYSLEVSPYQPFAAVGAVANPIC